MAYAYTYNKTTPADGDSTDYGNDEIQNLKKALQERLDAEHYWAYNGNTCDAATIGQHRKIIFYSQIAAPSPGTDKGALYTKDVSADHAELYWQNEAGEEVRLTDGPKPYLGDNLEYTEEVQLTNTGNSLYGDVVICTADGELKLPLSTEAAQGANEGDIFYDTATDVVKFKAAAAWRTLVSTATMAISNIKLGSYTGDGNATQAITGVGFQASVVIVLPSTGYNCFIKTSDMSTTEAKNLGTTNQTSTTNDSIRSLDADGFTVGDGAEASGDNMNNSGDTYYYIALKVVA